MSLCIKMLSDNAHTWE